MAKAKVGVNKSEEIRKAMGENPKASPAEIVEIVKGKGVEVNVGLVYQVKQNNGRKRKGKRNPNNQGKGKVVHSSKIKLGVGASIALAKTTADKVGGWAALKEIVDALA